MSEKHNASDRAVVLERIKRNIQDRGYHLYIVSGEEIPRYAYTIGFLESFGAELILAGAIYYMMNEIERIVPSVGHQITGRGTDGAFPVDSFGSFTLRKADESWVAGLMLGARDYYKVPEVNVFQLVPDKAHWTIDVPDMRKAWSAKEEPIWRWLHEDWPYTVPRKSTVTTNMAALRGARITEVARWGEDEWEMFSGPGPDVPHTDMRVVPLGVVLAADPSLVAALDLKVGRGLWRDESGGDWQSWGDSDAGSAS
jgi:hypothetical protein